MGILKIPAEKIPSDDCVVHVGRIIEGNQIKSIGTPYHVHKGEWIEVLPVRSMASYVELQKLISSFQSASKEDVEKETDLNAVLQTVERVVVNLDEALDRICQELGRRIKGWNWTDMESEPQPPPSPEVFRELDEEELFYLVRVIQGERPAARKKESKPSRKKSRAKA